MNHKPMLAVDCGDPSGLPFPLVVSAKLDGVRAVTTADGVVSRTLKRIPNKHVQSLLDGLPLGLDGELIVGDPTSTDCYRKTVSVVMSEDAPIEGLRFHVFDIQTAGTFTERFCRLVSLWQTLENTKAVVFVSQTQVDNANRLEAIEREHVEAGHEGVILRNPQGLYKHGRSTKREAFLLKMKRFSDSEAEVIGVTELMHNANEAKVNALGHTERSSHKGNKVGRGVMGALQVRDVTSGVEFEIGTGFTSEDRAALWTDWNTNGPARRERWPLAKYKYFALGSKDKPRFPVFLGWRDRRDV